MWGRAPWLRLCTGRPFFVHAIACPVQDGLLPYRQFLYSLGDSSLSDAWCGRVGVGSYCARARFVRARKGRC